MLYAPFVSVEPTHVQKKLASLRVFVLYGSSQLIKIRVVPVVTLCESCYFEVDDGLSHSLSGIQLADEYFSRSFAKVTVLIGLDY